MGLRLIVLLGIAFAQTQAFNGELAELECPDDCECHYFRVNWVTDCSDSNLTEIPYDELSPNVYVLDANSNHIEEVKPFPPDIKIRRLQIADNLMTDIRKESFANLNYLIDADFSGNRIRRVDHDAFEDFAGFITLELQGNPLEPVTGAFLSSKTLIYLDISNCGLAFLNPDFFANVTALATLDLSDNPLGKISNSLFEPLRSLEVLKMNNCNLTYIAHSSFEYQKNLKNLELADNLLTSLDWAQVFKNLIRLEYLDLRNSKITHVAEDTFDNNDYLRTLILAENELAGFDVASTIGEKLHELDTLDLSFCSLDKPLSEDAFSNSTKLRVLNLSGNSLFASDLLVALAPVVELRKLGLSNCGLGRLPDTFRKFKALQELDISHNPLNDVFIKLIEPIDTLEYLNMGYSNLSHISSTTFSKMVNLKRLVLSGNDLSNLDPGLFGGLTQLQSLELHDCGLKQSLNETLFFKNLTYAGLTELKLSGNPLEVSISGGALLPKQFENLETLDLSNCDIEYLPTDAFYFSQNITHLYLSGNNFHYAYAMDFLKMLPSLRVLDLRYNKLSQFSPGVIEQNPQIEKLKLVGNPWKCECSIAELWDWAQLYKGDLGILEGATAELEDVTAGKIKRKKLLTCSYSSEVQMPMVMNKTALGRKPFINKARIVTSTNRTWAKYVRESGCEQKAPERFRREVVEVLPDRISATASSKRHEPNTWAFAATSTLVLYITLMAIVVVTKYKIRNS